MNQPYSTVTSPTAEFSPPADLEQRRQGRDLRHSYIVQAPAGSGKTELLTQRMLGLLAQVENPEEVVAITFTRKAAAEMSHRLVRHLQAAARHDESETLEPHLQISRKLALAALEHDASQGWNLLEQPSRLRIRTIDSLCSELARQLPVLSGLGGAHRVAVDAEALYRLAAARTMAALEDDDDELKADVIRVLDRYNNQYDRLVELLTGMLANREQWLPHLLACRHDDGRREDGFDRQGLEASLRILIASQLELAQLYTPDSLLERLPAFFNFALENNPKDLTQLEALRDACGGFDQGPLDLPANADALVHWQTLIKRLLTADGNKWRGRVVATDGFPPPAKAPAADRERFKAQKDGFTALLKELSGQDQLREIYNTVRTLPNPHYEDEAWESLESLMRILLRAAGQWKLVMAESGEVDFGEIASRAIEALGPDESPSDLALRMDYRIQHLLVDEFQDTSASQIRLLNQLTAGWSDGDGRSLFLVGDPMQSIYRFRKAEVSLFIQAWQGQLFEHIQLNPLQLQVNFRSTSPIVNWVNNHFPEVMPTVSDPLMGAVTYSPAVTKPGVDDRGAVSLDILPVRDDEEEARQVVETIRQCDPNESVAVLVRSRNHASAILSELDRNKQKDERFRYQTIKFTPLAETTVIRDLVALTLALLQPVDRLAWLSTLRAPYIGLDLADLDTLVAGNSSTIILDALTTDSLAGLSIEGQQRLQRTAPVLQYAVNRRGRQSVRSLLESTWIRLGGPACIENDSELDDASTYFDLLDSLENENLPIDRDTLDLRMKDLYTGPDASASDRLQIMTIYAAKGLQFDTVILPGLNRTPATDKGKLLHWFELAAENRIVMSPMRNSDENERRNRSGDLISYITAVEKKRQQLENGRLLYVAATRAVHSLHMFAAIKPTVNNVIRPASGTLLHELWSAVHAEQAALVEQAAEQQGGPPDDEDSLALNLPLIYRRLTADWQLPTPPDSVVQAGAEIAEQQDDIEFSWAGEDARLTGNLVHRLLQLIGEQGLPAWEAGGGIATRKNWCRTQLASEGVHKDKADAIIERASSAIQICLASEHGLWILADHQDAQCEFALTAILDGRPNNMILDRTFVADNTRWIIDYKTSSHSGGNPEGFLDNEIKRYREQMERYRTAVALTETRPIKIALYFPLLDSLREL